jgi:hypothetical protein
MFSCCNAVFLSGLAVLMKPQSDSETVSVNADVSEQRRFVRLALRLLALVAVAVFLNGIGGAFVFDDEPTIVSNRSIRDLGNVAEIFSPPADATTWGRPLANATFALNYAVSGLEPWSYHVFNLLIHALAALALFGVVRRILRLPVLHERFAGADVWLALTTAGLWAVHPLQTESVTYVVQRVESLAGLCYLLTLYCFLRSVDAERGTKWQIAAVLACLLGAGCKEIVVSAPLMVLLCDRTWIAGTFREALRRRAWMYAGLTLSWVLLVVLVSGTENRSGTAGFGTASAWFYLLTQCRAILVYLKLVVWPTPLVFDYGYELVDGVSAVWPQALVLVALAAGVSIAIWRRSSWGVVGFWFFAILAPSSSVLPVATQTMAEHRMYLPLAAVVVSITILLFRWLERRALFILIVIALVWIGMTVRRNYDFRSKVAIWEDTVIKRPENWRARNNLGLALAGEGRQVEALAQFDRTLRLVPGTLAIRNNRATTLIALGRAEEGLTEIEAILAAAPQVAEFIDTKGMVLVALGRLSEAVACFREALRLKPELVEAQRHLAEATRSGK